MTATLSFVHTAGEIRMRYHVSGNVHAAPELAIVARFPNTDRSRQTCAPGRRTQQHRVMNSDCEGTVTEQGSGDRPRNSRGNASRTSMTNLSGEPDNEARELLWTACHDLGSPLGTIRLCAQKLLQRLRAGGPTEEELIDLALRIDRVAGHAVGMLDDVLEVERRKRYPYEEKAAESVGVELALSDAIAMHAESLARAGCSVFVSRAPQVDETHGNWDRRALERMFSNLLQNVARHAAGTTVNVDLSAARGWLQIRFADDGPGL